MLTAFFKRLPDLVKMLGFRAGVGLLCGVLILETGFKDVGTFNVGSWVVLNVV